MLSPRFSLLFAVLLVACDDKVDDSAPTDDTGDGPDYESGCILVDGGGGYRYLADALTVAGPGATIALCEGTIEETITIDKSVTITGPGPDLLVWNAPVNEPAVRVTGASDVTVGGFALNTTRNGIEVENATSVTISDVRFDSVANSGVRSGDSADLWVTGCTFNAPANGGVQVDGGSARVEASVFNAPLGYAVNAIGGSQVTVASSTISDVLYTSTDNGVNDGFALWSLDGSTLITDGNTLTNNFVHYFADEASMTLANDVVDGGLYGVFAAYGVLTMDNVTLTEVYLSPIRAVTNTDPVTLRNVSVLATPELVDTEEYDYANYFGGGITIASDALTTLEDVTVQGYNNNGILAIGAQDAPELVATRVNILDTGRRALTLYGGTATLTDVVVSGTTIYGSQDTPGQYNDQTPGLAVGLWSSSVTWTGGGVYDTEDMGMINFSGSLTLDNFTLAGNLNYGVWNYQGAVFASGSTFTRSSGNAGLMNMYGDLTVEGNTFDQNLEPYVYEYTYDDGTGNMVTTRYEQLYYSQDISCLDALTCNVRANTFTNGSHGVQISGGGDATIEGNTFTNYNSYVIRVYSVTGGTVEVLDNVLTESGAYPIYCYASTMEFENLTIDGVVGAAQEYASYTNGVEDYRVQYTSTGPAMYLSDCSIVASNLEISGATYHALYADDTALELYDTEVSGGSESGSSGYGTLRVGYSGTAPALLASGLQIDAPAVGYGLQVASTASVDAGVIVLEDVTISGGTSSGLSLESVRDAELSLVSVTGTALHGLAASDSTFILEDSLFEGNAGYGAWIDGAAGAVSITDTIFDDNVTGGVYLSDATATFIGNVANDNDGYGMTCATDLTLSACSGNDLSGNAAGEHSGCDDACAQ